MFKCDECEKEFETQKGLQGHKMGAHTKKRGDRTDTKRKERVPVGVKQYKLKSEHSPGKIGRWVNDTEGRLNRFRQGGYEHVDDPDATESTDGLGSKKCKVVDKNTGMKAYLMEIDKDLYDEDQAAKQGELDKIDNRIRTGTINNQLGRAGYTHDEDGVDLIKYQPKSK